MATNRQVSVGRFIFDQERRMIIYGSKTEKVSAAQSSLLEFLLRHPDEYVAVGDLARHVRPSAKSPSVRDLIIDLNRRVAKLNSGSPLVTISEGRFCLALEEHNSSPQSGRFDVVDACASELRAPENTDRPNAAALERPSIKRHRNIILPTAACLAALTFVAVAARRTGPAIHYQSTQLTYTGHWKYSPVLTDGIRVFFTEVTGGVYRIGETNISGGEVQYLHTSIRNPYACDISPNGEELLVRSVSGSFDDYGSLWTIPIIAGRPSQIASEAFDGSWSPDGQSILVARGRDLSIVTRSTGAARHIFKSEEGFVWWPRWSRDSRLIRFTVTDPTSQLNSIWEIQAKDGAGKRRLFADRSDFDGICCGNWTRNGRSFIFQVTQGRVHGVWAVAEDPWYTFLHGASPVKIAGDPLSYGGPTQDSRSKVILTRGLLSRGKPLMFDVATSVFLPAVDADLSVSSLAYSLDGQSLAFVSLPDESLWIANSEGTHRRRITSPPIRAAAPAWSPDGNRLAVMLNRPGDHWRLVVVSPTTASIDYVTSETMNEFDPSWSEDGSAITFGHIPTLDGAGMGLKRLSLRERKITNIAGSKGLFSPAVSHDGRYIAAIKEGTFQAYLLDIRKGQWVQLAHVRVGYPRWSPDNNHVTFLDPDASSIRFLRVDVHTRNMERIGQRRSGGLLSLRFWLGMHPTGNPIVIEDRSTNEVFALRPSRH